MNLEALGSFPAFSPALPLSLSLSPSFTAGDCAIRVGALGHHLYQEEQGRQLEEQSLHKAGEGGTGGEWGGGGGTGGE